MRKGLSEAFDRLSRQERAFADAEFLAPVAPGQQIAVRVAGVVLRLSPEPNDFSGWGVFRPRGLSSAVFLRHPRVGERARYLQLLPPVRLLLSGRRGQQWFGRQAAPCKVTLRGDAPLHLARDVQVFDTVRARFDGGNFWFEEREPAGGRQADYLRDSLNGMSGPDSLEFAGLPPVARDLYRELFVLRRAELAEAARDRTEDRLRGALAHAGAVLRGYRELSDVYTVDYEVDGVGHTSVVDKNNLGVQSAGICLSGGDRSFDLASLVGVIREGTQQHRIVRVGIDR